MNEFAIQVTGLTKRYHQVTAVDHITFEVKKGELFDFLGPNGAGKATTARMLTGVIVANEGSALVIGYKAGQPWRQADIRRRTVDGKSLCRFIRLG